MSRHVLILGLVVLLMAGWVVTVRATSQLLPRGDLIAQVNSPTNDYRLCFYRNCAGGTTGKCAVVGVATDCKTGAARRFYFDYTEEEIGVSWTGPSTVRHPSQSPSPAAPGCHPSRCSFHKTPRQNTIYPTQS